VSVAIDDATAQTVAIERQGKRIILRSLAERPETD